MSGWQYQPINMLGFVQTGSTPRTSEAHFYGGDIPFVTPAELDQTDPIITAPRTLSEIGGREARLVPEGTILVCCIGSLGKVGIAGRTIAVNQQINSIEFDRRVIWPRFGFYACRLLKPIMENMAPATTLPIISKSKFEKLQIPVPPLAKQQQIAEALDRAEALRTKRRIGLAQLDFLVQSVFISMFGDPATNPKGWKTTQLHELVNEFRYGTSNKSEAQGKPALRIPNIVCGIIDLTDLKLVPVDDDEFKRLRLVNGDILFVRTNGNPNFVGRCAIFDSALAASSGFPSDEFIFASYLIRARLGKDRITPIFIREFMLGTEGRKELRSRSKTSAGQFNINTENLGSISIPLPPLDLQREFASRVTTMEKLKAVDIASLAKMDELFAALQYRAFQGEL